MLHKDEWFCVLRFLNMYDVTSIVARVCKSWHAAVQSNERQLFALLLQKKRTYVGKCTSIRRLRNYAKLHYIHQLRTLPNFFPFGQEDDNVLHKTWTHVFALVKQVPYGIRSKYFFQRLNYFLRIAKRNRHCHYCNMFSLFYRHVEQYFIIGLQQKDEEMIQFVLDAIPVIGNYRMHEWMMPFVKVWYTLDDTVLNRVLDIVLPLCEHCIKHQVVPNHYSLLFFTAKVTSKQILQRLWQFEIGVAKYYKKMHLQSEAPEWVIEHVFRSVQGKTVQQMNTWCKFYAAKPL